MKATELLITGYDGDEPVFAVNLAPERATTVLTKIDVDGETAVHSTAELETDIFETVQELLASLG